jgi:hypothetical protein
MLWTTNTNGRYRCMRFINGFAFKAPYLFRCSDLILDWRRVGETQLTSMVVERMARQILRCHKAQSTRGSQMEGDGSAQQINGVSLCPVRFHLPRGLLVVMTKADPLGRSPTFPTEDYAARMLIGWNQDTGKADTFGIINGKVVVVDYGWWVKRRII